MRRSRLLEYVQIAAGVDGRPVLGRAVLPDSVEYLEPQTNRVRQRMASVTAGLGRMHLEAISCRLVLGILVLHEERELDVGRRLGTAWHNNASRMKTPRRVAELRPGCAWSMLMLACDRSPARGWSGFSSMCSQPSGARTGTP